MFLINSVLILLIIILIAIGVMILFRKDKTILKEDIKVEETNIDKYSISYLAHDIKTTFNLDYSSSCS